MFVHTRVRELDDPAPLYPLGGLDADVFRWLWTVADGLHADPTDRGALPIAQSPERLDALVEDCQLLKRLRSRAPGVVDGPLPDDQVWVVATRPEWLPAREELLAPQHFVPLTTAANLKSVKPFDVGLFTSSPIEEGFGLWWSYLSIGEGALWPRPWQVWRAHVSSAARVFEVNSASRWFEFVTMYPSREVDVIYPDWLAVAADFDAVHYTLKAVTATNDVWLVTVDDDLIAAPQWAVESTFWLRWCFDAVDRFDGIEAN